MSDRLDRSTQRSDDVLSSLAEVELRDVSEVLGHRLAGAGEDASVQEIGVVEDVLHDGRDAADGVEVAHRVLAGRGQVAEVGGPVGDLLEFLNLSTVGARGGDRSASVKGGIEGG